MSKSLCTQVIIWINSIQNHIDTRMDTLGHEGSCSFKPHIYTRVNLLRHEGACVVYRPEWSRTQNYCHILISYLVFKKCEILILDTYPNGLKNKRYQSNLGVNVTQL